MSPQSMLYRADKVERMSKIAPPPTNSAGIIHDEAVEAGDQMISDFGLRIVRAGTKAEHGLRSDFGDRAKVHE